MVGCFFCLFVLNSVACKKAEVDLKELVYIHVNRGRANHTSDSETSKYEYTAVNFKFGGTQALRLPYGTGVKTPVLSLFVFFSNMLCSFISVLDHMLLI